LLKRHTDSVQETVRK